MADVLQQLFASAAAAAPDAATTTEWTLALPHGTYVEADLVNVLKRAQLISNPEDADLGWDACRVLNALKKPLCDGPESCALSMYRVYMGALCHVRRHLASNTQPYVYGQRSSADYDFELFMAISGYAARRSRDAQNALALDTAEAACEAAYCYRDAAGAIGGAAALLLRSIPDTKRVGGASAATRDWAKKHLLPSALRDVNGDQRLALAAQIVEARAALLTAESAHCIYRGFASQEVADEDRSEFQHGLATMALFVAEQYRGVLDQLRRISPALHQERIGRHAEVLYRILLLEKDVHASEGYYAHAILHTDPYAMAQCVRQMQAADSQNLSGLAHLPLADRHRHFLSAARTALSACRQRADAARANTDLPFGFLSLDDPLSVPLAVAAQDPWPLFLAEDPDAAAPFSLADMEHEFEARSDAQKLLSLLALCGSTPPPSDTAPVLPASGERRLVADVVLATLLERVRDANPTNANRLLLADSRVLAELIQAFTTFGMLIERERWLTYSYQLEEEGEGASPIKSELLLLSKGLQDAVTYFKRFDHEILS